jgi:hypothetical protein
MSKWAYLPVGPLQRHLREGIRGEFFEKRSESDLQEGMDPYLGGEVNVEASVSYLYRCAASEKVACGKNERSALWRMA